MYSYQSESPYNIPSPEPFHAGSYTQFLFEIENPFDNTIPDLRIAEDIEFAMSLYGNYDSDIALKFSQDHLLDEKQRIFVDNEQPNILTIKLFAKDTIDFEDGYYDFQISLKSINRDEDSVIGQGKVMVLKKI